jgi:hypothetical protein
VYINIVEEKMALHCCVHSELDTVVYAVEVKDEGLQFLCPWVQIVEVSSIYLNQKRDLWVTLLNASSKFSVVIRANGQNPGYSDSLS